MKTVDIVDVITMSIEKTILNGWKHEGYIDDEHSNGVSIVIDGQRYKIVVEPDEV